MNSLKVKANLTAHRFTTTGLTLNKSVKKQIKELLLPGQKITKVVKENHFGTIVWKFKNSFGVNLIHAVKDPGQKIQLTYWR